MRTLAKLLLFTIFIIFIFAGRLLALPPSIQAVNAYFESNHVYSALAELCSSYLDDAGNIHLVFRGREGMLQSHYIKFSLTGDIPVNELNLNTKICISKYNIVANNDYVAIVGKGCFDYSGYEFIFIDKHGAILVDSVYTSITQLSNMHFLSDGRFIANAYFRSASNISSDQFIIKSPKANELNTILVESTPTFDKSISVDADFYSLDSGLILLISTAFSESGKINYIRKSIIDIELKKVLEFEYLPINEISSVYYKNISPHFALIRPTLFEVGDKLVYLTYTNLPKELANELPPIYSTILFDKKGRLIPNDKRETMNFETQSFQSTYPGDILIRNEQYKFNQDFHKCPVSLYNILSLRNYPQLIIDDNISK